ncbi:MAG: hypothetical protein ACLQEQ_00765 [Nitrososphaerales archaeon]
MSPRRAYVYAALGVAAAVAYGVGVGPYWEADAFVFAVTASVVAFFSFTERGMDQLLSLMTFLMGRASRLRGAKTAVIEGDRRERMPVPRSRIAHYVTVSRIKSTTSIARESDSPFERALLIQPGWRRLSASGLEEVTKMVPDASAKSAQ